MKLQQLQVTLIVLGLVGSATLQGDKHDLGSHAATNVSLRNEIKLHDALKAIENFIEAEESPNARQADSGADCITSLQISAETGAVKGAGFSDATIHQVALHLKSGTVLKGNLKGPVFYDSKKDWHLNPATDFQPSHQCLKPSDIAKVSIVAGGDDNWYITKIATNTKVGMEAYKVLTNDPTFFKWLDNQSPASSELVLRLGMSTSNVHTPHCTFGVPFCECKADADVCIFHLEVDEILTFVSYPKLELGGTGSGLIMRGLEAALWHINEDGKQEPLPQYNNSSECAEHFTSATCSDPLFVDGKTYRMAIGVNGQIPGPTLVVHEKQKVVVHVKNNLTSEGISVHWHGIIQTGTPWNDGVGQITQCHLLPGTTYSYIFLAEPSGTMWYHSHSGAQRTDGLFGALIVKERSNRMKQIKAMLSKEGVKDFEDHPTKHTLSVLDWHEESSLHLFSQLNDGIGFYPGVPAGEVPSSDSSKYFLTFGVEMAAMGPTPFTSGLINGKGRHSSVPYSKTRLSVFSVVRGRSYRFRLIGAMGRYPFRFSIDGHKLTVVNTDGYWIKPIKDVDYIILHTGERFDFILEANCDSADLFWMRAETLEANTTFGKDPPPYKYLGHTAEGILQYIEPGEQATEIDSTEYECIKDDSIPVHCTSAQKCKAVNCPFKDYHPSYNIHCINVNEFQLLEPTPAEEMPTAYPSTGCKECIYFMNFNFEGFARIGSVNGRNFVLPPAPPMTQPDDFYKQASLCELEDNCNPFQISCLCTHLINIPYKKTIQFVWTSIGGDSPEVHPIHLHGHSFHVVHIGYPKYNETTGFVYRYRVGHNQDIDCDDCNGTPKDPECDSNKCTKPKWKNDKSPEFSINSTTVRKDTVMVPAGGYVVINFISDNPGYWFLHCHVEDHTLEGMGILINEAFNEQQCLPGRPQVTTKCGNSDLNGGIYEAVAALQNN